MAPAPTRPATWVFAPACSATAVLDPLVLTGNPWNSPAATFAAPIPIISWLPWTWSPARDANADAVESCPRAHEHDAQGAREQQREVRERHVGIVNGGNPLGSGPTTDTPWAVEIEQFTATIASTTATRTAGIFGITLCRTRMRASAAHADGQRRGHGLAVGDAVDEPRSSGMNPSASTENPNSFGSWPTRIVSARPFM